MDQDEIKNILKQLADSQENEDKKTWAVLYWKAQGLKHQEIADMWGRSYYWVQRYMTRTHAIFGTTDWKNADKEHFLDDLIYPAIKDLIKTNPFLFKEPPPLPADEPERPEPDPEPEVIDARWRRLPGPVSPKRRSYAGLVLFAILLAAVGYFAYRLGRNQPQTAPTTTSIPLSSPTPFPQSSVAMTTPPTQIPSITAILPTDTPVPPTDTLVPTVFVPPANGILFVDNFDNGWKSDWDLGTDWITSDGALSQTTQAAFHNYYSWATLNEPDWKNYTLSVKINIPYMGSAAQSNVAVAVRVNGQPKYIGVQILPFVGNALFFIGNSYADSDAVASSRVFDFESGSTLQIEASGNNFAVSVDGRQVQQVSISGYDSGGIALGIDCLSSLGCPSFDDVKVTYLP